MKLAFKCIDNDLLNQWFDDRKQEIALFYESADKLARAHGLESYIRQYQGGMKYMAGFSAPEGTSTIDPKLFRKSHDYYINDRDFYLPNRRTNNGKELQALMNVARIGGQELPGLVYDAFVESRSLITSPGSNKIGAQWYASYGHVISDLDLSRIDSAVWEKIRPSELMRIYEDEEERIASLTEPQFENLSVE